MIQIDMEMPKCCDECFALDDHGDYPFCLISQDQRGYTFNVRENRMPSCPLKAREPRVMTLEEAKSTYVIEYRSGKMREVGAFLLDLDVDPLNAEYGKIYRVWTSRPTDEQREVAKWE